MQNLKRLSGHSSASAGQMENGNLKWKMRLCIGELYMLGPNTEQLKIMKLDPSKPVKAVGITQSVDGSMTG